MFDLVGIPHIGSTPTFFIFQFVFEHSLHSTQCLLQYYVQYVLYMRYSTTLSNTEQCYKIFLYIEI